MLTRHEFLRIAAAAGGSWLLPRPAAWAWPPQAAADDRIAPVARIIEAYDGQGIHRTATDADDRSALWLRDEAKQSGVDAMLESFSLNRVDPVACFLQAADRKIEGLPLFDGTFTDERGLVGRLGPPESNAEIALLQVDAAGISSEGQSIAAQRGSSTHRALVVVTRGAHDGLSPTNAVAFGRPFGLPALQVGSEHAAALADYVRRGTEVRFVAHAKRTPDSGSNVVATIRGRQADLAPLVVMTPRSGWWHCAAERGGGLACWLEACRAAVGAGPVRPVLFVASSGHELGHLGLDAFISRRPDLVKRAAAWIHLGANIGAAGGAVRIQASDDGIEEMALAALRGAGAEVRQRVPRGTVPGGEARNIHVGGGRYVSLLGSSPFFHSPADRWPAAVDAPAVARFAAAIANLAVSLTS